MSNVLHRDGSVLELGYIPCRRNVINKTVPSLVRQSHNERNRGYSDCQLRPARESQLLETGCGAPCARTFLGKGIMGNGRRLFKASGKPADTVLLHFRHVRGAVAGIFVRFCAIGPGTALECLDATWVVRAEGREIVHWEAGQFYFQRNVICGSFSLPWP